MKVKFFSLEDSFITSENEINEFMRQVKVVHVHQSSFGGAGGSVCFSIWYDENTTSAKHVEELLDKSSEILGLSTRPCRALVLNASLATIRQICVKTDSDLLKYRNVGKKSLKEIKEKLATFGLQTGMDVSQYP